MSGMTGENLLRLMEQRLDNVIFRLGLAATRIQARQIVNHGHILIDGKRVDIPSYEVSVGEVITIRPSIRQAVMERKFSMNRSLPSWISFNEDQFSAKIEGLPTRSDIDFEVSERAIVELYSK
jgi:small subunit ribosomal protein S4